MAKRIVFGLLWTAIGISALFLMHTWIFMVFAMFLCFMATYELNRSIGLKNKPIMILSLVVSTISPIYYEYGYLLRQVDGFNLKTEYLITAYVLVLCFLMLHNHENTKFSDVSFVVMSSLFVPFAFTRLMYFRDIAVYYPDKGYTNAHGIFLILFILFSACMTDTFAYFAGSFLGKHKLCPKISPKKTVEGAVGGVLGCILANVILYAVYNNFFFEKELYIKALTPEKVYTTVADDVFLEFIKCDVYCYSLYFDNVEHSMQLLKVAEERQYSFSPVASISNLSLVTRSIEILGSFLRIIEIALLIACTFYLGSFGIRSIKSNMYEIGVIKSLGGSNKDIGKIFVIQNLIVGIGVVLLSVLGMYIAAKVSNEILIQSFKTVLNTTIKSIKLVQFYPTLVVIDLFIAVILIIVSSFIPTRFLRKVRPIDILKAKE